MPIGCAMMPHGNWQIGTLTHYPFAKLVSFLEFLSIPLDLLPIRLETIPNKTVFFAPSFITRI
jgi:hypothetical protein